MIRTALADDRDACCLSLFLAGIALVIQTFGA